MGIENDMDLSSWWSNIPGDLFFRYDSEDDSFSKDPIEEFFDQIFGLKNQESFITYRGTLDSTTVTLQIKIINEDGEINVTKIFKRNNYSSRR